MRLALAAALASAFPLFARADSPILAALDRGACYGTCPSYQVVVHEDGSVGYCGRLYVAEKGTRDASLDPKKLAELRAAFADASFLAFDERELHPAEDASEVVLFFRSGKQSRRIGFTNAFGAPRVLAQLAKKVDATVGSKKWVGEPQKDRAHHHAESCGVPAKIGTNEVQDALSKLEPELRQCPRPDGPKRNATFHAVVNGAGGIRELKCASGACEGTDCVASVLKKLALPPSLADGDPLEIPVSP
jgi:hypothetical protein